MACLHAEDTGALLPDPLRHVSVAVRGQCPGRLAAAFAAVLQLLVAALAVNLAVLASAGPIVAFFSFSTSNGDFMCLLNVLVFAVSGILGMVFLLQIFRP